MEHLLMSLKERTRMRVMKQVKAKSVEHCCGWEAIETELELTLIFKIPSRSTRSLLYRGIQCPRVFRPALILFSRHFLRALAAVNQEEHSHPDGEAIGDLFQNDRAAAIGDVTINFHAAVDGA